MPQTFSGGEPLHRHHPYWGGGTPLPRTYPLGAYGASIKFIPPNQIPGYALSNTIDQGTGPPNFEDVVAPLLPVATILMISLTINFPNFVQ